MKNKILLISLLFILLITGCRTPSNFTTSTPWQEVTPFKLPPTSTPTVIFTPQSSATAIIFPTKTLVPLSSFEECVIQGKLVERTYPRQCTSANGQVFREELPKGVVFSQVYGKKGHDETPYSIITTMDGGYFVTGQTDGYSCLIRKTDSVGETEWEYTLGQELRDEFQFTNGLFTCWSARQIPDGGFVVIATGREEMGNKHNSFLLKFDSAGNRNPAEEFRWREGKSLKLDKDGNPYWESMFGLAGAWIETSDGGYAMIGRFWVDAPDESTHIYRADANGNYLWDKNLCRDKNVTDVRAKQIVCSENSIWDGIQSQDGGFVLAGTIPGIWLIKMDADGNYEWTQFYDGSRPAVTQTPAGGFLIAGDRNGDGLLIKTDSQGNLLWSQTLGGVQDDRLYNIIRKSDGRIIVMGTTKSFGEGIENTWLLEIDPSDLE